MSLGRGQGRGFQEFGTFEVGRARGGHPDSEAGVGFWGLEFRPWAQARQNCPGDSGLPSGMRITVPRDKDRAECGRGEPRKVGVPGKWSCPSGYNPAKARAGHSGCGSACFLSNGQEVTQASVR